MKNDITASAQAAQRHGARQASEHHARFGAMAASFPSFKRQERLKMHPRYAGER